MVWPHRRGLSYENYTKQRAHGTRVVSCFLCQKVRPTDKGVSLYLAQSIAYPTLHAHFDCWDEVIDGLAEIVGPNLISERFK